MSVFTRECVCVCVRLCAFVCISVCVCMCACACSSVAHKNVSGINWHQSRALIPWPKRRSEIRPKLDLVFLMTITRDERGPNRKKSADAKNGFHGHSIPVKLMPLIMII